jgi:hypothetical protein
MDQQFIDLMSYLVSYLVNYSVILLSNSVICYTPLSYPVFCYAALNMFNRIPMYVHNPSLGQLTLQLIKYISQVGHVTLRRFLGTSTLQQRLPDGIIPQTLGRYRA